MSKTPAVSWVKYSLKFVDTSNRVSLLIAGFYERLFLTPSLRHS